jgi:hypothetical protein
MTSARRPWPAGINLGKPNSLLRIAAGCLIKGGMTPLTTTQFLEIDGTSEMEIKDAVRRYKLPFQGKRGQMRMWSETDYLIWRVFQQLRPSHGIHSGHVAQEIAEFAERQPEANDFVIDEVNAWFAVRPTDTLATIRKRWKRPAHLHLINIAADRAKYRKAAGSK